MGVSSLDNHDALTTKHVTENICFSFSKFYVNHWFNMFTPSVGFNVWLSNALTISISVY